MPPDRAFIAATLGDMEEAVRFLRELSTQTAEAFITDVRSCYASAYALIIAIEGVAGVAAHLVAAGGIASPKGLAETFDVLHRAGIIADAGLRERLAAMATFRNLLMHRYWRVDYNRVHTILRDNLDDFGAFAAEVLRFLEKEA